jgi:cytochrome c peroxidase
LNLVARGGDEKAAFLVAYGHALFNSPELFGEKARALGMSCATCHNNGDANRDLFVAGLSARKGGIDVTSKFFHATADNGVFDPLDIPSLRGVRFTAPYGHDGRIASLREFVAMVIVTEFGGAEPTTLMLDALTAFLNQLDFLPAPFVGRSGRLAADAPEAAKRGEIVFVRHCASCHQPDSYFVDGKRHDGFDTPTLLGVAHTPPYMHDGSLATLAEVTEHFDKALGLELSPSAKSDVTAYVEVIGVGTEPYQRTPVDETAIFASTLDLLIAQRDRFHAMLLVRSLAPKLDSIGEAVLAEDWDAARKRYEEYRAARRN